MEIFLDTLTRVFDGEIKSFYIQGAGGAGGVSSF